MPRQLGSYFWAGLRGCFLKRLAFESRNADLRATTSWWAAAHPLRACREQNGGGKAKSLSLCLSRDHHLLLPMGTGAPGSQVFGLDQTPSPAVLRVLEGRGQAMGLLSLRHCGSQSLVPCLSGDLCAYTTGSVSLGECTFPNSCPKPIPGVIETLCGPYFQPAETPFGVNRSFMPTVCWVRRWGRGRALLACGM